MKEGLGLQLLPPSLPADGQYNLPLPAIFEPSRCVAAIIYLSVIPDVATTILHSKPPS